MKHCSARLEASAGHQANWWDLAGYGCSDLTRFRPSGWYAHSSHPSAGGTQNNSFTPSCSKRYRQDGQEPETIRLNGSTNLTTTTPSPLNRPKSPVLEEFPPIWLCKVMKISLFNLLIADCSLVFLLICHNGWAPCRSSAVEGSLWPKYWWWGLKCGCLETILMILFMLLMDVLLHLQIPFYFFCFWANSLHVIQLSPQLYGGLFITAPWVSNSFRWRSSELLDSSHHIFVWFWRIFPSSCHCFAASWAPSQSSGSRSHSEHVVRCWILERKRSTNLTSESSANFVPGRMSLPF